MDRPSLSWSKSRQESFESCKRQYFYRYYGYWNGWKTNAPQKIRQTYYLKNLVNIDAIIGVIVHNSIKNFLNAFRSLETIPNLALLLKGADKQWNNVLSDTRERKYRNRKLLAVLEANYGEEISDKVNNAVEKTKFCLTNFYSYITKQTFQPHEIYIIDDPELGFFEYSLKEISFRIYAVIDLAVWKNGKDLIIYDWKTGVNDMEYDVKPQLLTYGLWAIKLLDIVPENVRLKVINLSRVDETEYKFLAEDYLMLLNEIENAVVAMIDFETKGWNIEDNFPLTDNLDTCKMCAFREVCPRYAKS